MQIAQQTPQHNHKQHGTRIRYAEHRIRTWNMSPVMGPRSGLLDRMPTNTSRADMPFFAALASHSCFARGAANCQEQTGQVWVVEQGARQPQMQASHNAALTSHFQFSNVPSGTTFMCISRWLLSGAASGFRVASRTCTAFGQHSCRLGTGWALFGDIWHNAAAVPTWQALCGPAPGSSSLSQIKTKQLEGVSKAQLEEVGKGVAWPVS